MASKPKKESLTQQLEDLRSKADKALNGELKRVQKRSKQWQKEAQKRSKAFQKEAQKRAKKFSKELENQVGDVQETVFSVLGLATKSEVAQLKKKINSLSRKVTELNKAA